MLRFSITIGALTSAWLMWRHLSPINGWLFMGLGFEEGTARAIERTSSIVLLLCALGLAIRSNALACAGVALIGLLFALAKQAQGGEPFSNIAPIAGATTILAPVSLWLLCRGFEASAANVLRFAIASTFLAHGYEAFSHNPQFIDLVLPSARRTLGWNLTESHARVILTLIGVQDVALAAALCLRRWRWVAAYMAFWGLLTLGSRVLAWGPERWPEAAIRCSNAGAPLALALHWRASQHKSEKT